MPSTAGKSTNPNSTETRTRKQRTASIESDEARLLWGFGRRNDAAAVPITRPTPRPMSKSQLKIPSGGPRPKNTLQNDLYFQRSDSRQAATRKSRIGEDSHLSLQASRGDNLTHMPHATALEGSWAVSSPKRQKISHQAISPSSGTSTDELIDQHSPDKVIFGPSRRSSQAVSTQSFNSQTSCYQPKQNGTFARLTEHRNVERMMDSSSPSKKRTHRGPSQDHQRNHGRMSSPEPSPSSQPIDLSGFDEREGIVEAQAIPVGERSHRNPVDGLSLTIDELQADLSTANQDPIATTKSPHFPQPQLPSRDRDRSHEGRLLKGTHARNDKLSDRLDEQFIQTNGTRRSSHNNLSSETDELQSGTTVGRNQETTAASLTSPQRSISPHEESLLKRKLTKTGNQDTGLDPSDIKPSEFISVKPKAQNDSRFSGPPIREKKAPWSVQVSAVTKEGEFVTREQMALVQDERSASYIVKVDGKSLGVKIVPQKLLKIQWEISGRKIRFSSSQVGSEEYEVDLELRKEKDVAELVSKLGTHPGCKTVSVSSERMNKMFEKRRSDMKSNMASAHARHLDENNVLNGDTKTRTRQTNGRKTLGLEETRREPHKRIVDELLARSALEKAPLIKRVDTREVTAALPREESVSNVLERLKPKHNDHLRRSSRTSSDIKKPYRGAVDDLDNFPLLARYSKIHDLGEPWKKPLVYPKVGKKKTTVEFSDLERLDEGEFLNDNLLSFYLRFLEHTLEEQRPDLAERVYFFNTFFFATLMNTHKGRKGFNYEGVQKWTRNVDLFTFDYIVVPINEATHWYLAIICNLPALDRRLSSDENDSRSPAIPAVSAKDASPVDLCPDSSSLTHGLTEEEHVKLVEEADEPDESGARSSFAELSLDGDKRPLSAINISENIGEETTGLIDEDGDMLDGQVQDALPAYQPGKDEGRLIEDVVDPIEDPDQPRKAAEKSRKGKRKSGPPAVTKISPDKPAIITFDSLGMSRSTTIRILKDYLREEAKAKRGGMEFELGQIKGITASQIPQQDNFYDCGVFLLGYVAKFLEDDPKEFIAKIIKRDYDEIKDWPNLKASTLRNSIREQVLRLHQDQVAERQKDREVQKTDKEPFKEDQRQHSSPVRSVDPTKSAKQDPPHRNDNQFEEQPNAHVSAQPMTVKDASENASSIDPDDPTKNMAGLKQSTKSDKVGEVKTQKTDPEGEGQLPKSQSSRINEPDQAREKQGASKSLRNEPSVIFVDSQSQQDGLPPTSFSDSHPAASTSIQVQKSPDLPPEIQDSQPSQTPKTPTHDTHVNVNEGGSPVSRRREYSQEIPIVLIPDPRVERKRKADNDSPTATRVVGRSEEQKRSPGKQPLTKKKRIERRIQTSDEVINIDD